MDKSVKFRIELESNGDKVFHALEINADDLNNAVREVVKETRELTQEFDHWQKNVLD